MWADVVAQTNLFPSIGRVEAITGGLLIVKGARAGLGSLVFIGDERVRGEVVGFTGDLIQVVPEAPVPLIKAGTVVRFVDKPSVCLIGPSLLGQTLDGYGQPILGGVLTHVVEVPLHKAAPNPMLRKADYRQWPTGISVLDICVPLVRGQRLGIFAPAGIGKTTLLGMLAQNLKPDVLVLALVGERGREVQEIRSLVPQERTVTVVATSNTSTFERVRALETAVRIAEYFRDEGADVLLMADSLTRWALAVRELSIGLGEPLGTDGFPQRMYQELPRLLERLGPAETGNITSIFSVLADPGERAILSQWLRGLVDGHLVLNDERAQQGIYPAIDPLLSLSRLMEYVFDPEMIQLRAKILRAYFKARDATDLLAIGGYEPGRDAQLDESLALVKILDRFFSQLPTEYRVWKDTLQAVAEEVNRYSNI